MKKILSLVLAVLMLASLAISASAITVPFKNDCKDNMLDSLIDYHKWYYLYGCQAGNFEPLTGTWYDSCPGCDGLAEYFTYEGKVVWLCLDDCGEVGFRPIVNTTPSFTVPTHSKTATCPKCDKNTNTFFIAAGFLNGKLNYSYFCYDCKYSFYVETTSNVLPDCNACHKPTCTQCHTYQYCIFCSPCLGGTGHGTTHFYLEDFTGFCPDCKSRQYLQFYYTYGDKEYAFFKCANDHAHAYPKKSTVVIKPSYGCYLCGKYGCYGDCQIIDPGFTYPTTTPSFKCLECSKNLTFQFTYTQLGITYAYYKCADGHSYSFVVKDGAIIKPGVACTYCGKYNCDGSCYVIDPGFTYPTLPSLPGIKDSYKCTECDKDAEYLYYFTVNGKLYGHYECVNGHTAAYPLYTNNYPVVGDMYRITVLSTDGCAYKISGNYYAKGGEYKTINFTPKAGYVLTGVTVNGQEAAVSDNGNLTIKITGNTVIRAYYSKVSTVEKYAITAMTNGNGTITATKNGVAADSAAIKVSTADVITYKFTPKSANYYIADVKVDGKSVGAVSTYTFRGVTDSHTLSVEFKWKSPYNYLAPGYEKAVEYVTETGIMEPLSYVKNKAYFGGTSMISVKTFAMALAEMADVKGLLGTDLQRENWAKQIGLITAADKLDQACDVQTACRIIDTYLEYVQKQSGVKFVNFDSAADAMANGISIGLVTEKGYNANRTLTRYDLASVCYLIKGLKYSVN